MLSALAWAWGSTGRLRTARLNFVSVPPRCWGVKWIAVVTFRLTRTLAGRARCSYLLVDTRSRRGSGTAPMSRELKQDNRKDARAERRERLAQELRANLLKRKALARARRSHGRAESEEAEERAS